MTAERIAEILALLRPRVQKPLSYRFALTDLLAHVADLEAQLAAHPDKARLDKLERLGRRRLDIMGREGMWATWGTQGPPSERKRTLREAIDAMKGHD